MRRLLGISTLLASTAVAPAVAADDFATTCREFTASRVIFTGRVLSAPITKRVSGEEQIEKARRSAVQAESELEQFRALKLRPSAAGQRERELAEKARGMRDLYERMHAMMQPPMDIVVTPVRVETPFRGVQTAILYVRTSPPTELQPGQTYLIYAHQSVYVAPDSYQDIVTATRVVERRAVNVEELRFLELARTRTFSSAVYGSIFFEDNLTQVPLAGVPIRFTVGDSHFELMTNEAGRFLATGIPAGTVIVDAELPPHMTFGYLGPPHTYVMPDGGCLEVSLRAKWNGRVRGRILLNDGSPVGGPDHGSFVSLTRLPGSASEMQSSHFIETQENGGFEFSGLSPGHYVLGVNLRSLPSIHAPFSPTYYPGVAGLQGAIPIMVMPDGEPVVIDWVLHASVASGELEVVVDAGGGSASIISACAVALTADGQISSNVPYAPRIRRGTGALLIPVMEGIRYRIAARASFPKQNMDSQPLEVVGTAGRQSITLSTDSPATADADSVCECVVSTCR